MTEHARRNQGCPGSDEILLHLSGELDRLRRRRVDSHLRGCWNCIAEAERLKQGIHLFVEFKDRHLYPSVPVPPPSPRALRQKLEDASESRPPFPILFAIGLIPYRTMWITVTASVTAILFFLLAVRPEQMQAGEFVRRASVSNANSAAKGWIHQRVEIRHGGETVYWDGWHGPGNKLIAASGPNASWGSGLQGPLRWNDPLSPDHFAEWRHKTAGAHDTVEDRDGLRTLRCVPSQNEIRMASLTVHASDFHPTAKRVEYADQRVLEATELIWEYRNAPVMAKTERLPSPPASNRTIDVPPPQQETPNLDEAEIEARRVLFDLRVGLTGDEPGFVLLRKAGIVQVEVYTASDSRREQIRQALDGIAGVEPRIFGPETSRNVLPELPVEDASDEARTTAGREPLLWDSIVKSAGSDEQALRLTHQISVSGAALRAAVAQLQGLAVRYPSAGLAADPLRGRVLLLASQMFTEVEKRGGERVRLLESIPLLKPVDERLPAESGSWQEDAATLFRLISRNDQLSARLFAVNYGAAPDSEALPGLVRTFSQLQSKILARARRQAAATAGPRVVSGE